MENNIAIAPSKKQKTEIDYRYCLIYQQHLASEGTVTTLKSKSIETMLKLMRKMFKQIRLGRPETGKNFTVHSFAIGQKQI